MNALQVILILCLAAAAAAAVVRKPQGKDSIIVDDVPDFHVIEDDVPDFHITEDEMVLRDGGKGRGGVFEDQVMFDSGGGEKGAAGAIVFEDNIAG